MQKDYIIVGQGIAGSVLAFTLMREAKNILMVDENIQSSSSKVAAGLYNPIVFKRIVKSWLADKVLSAADNLYVEMENYFNTKFHHKREIVKLFSSEEEKHFWLSKASNPELAVYLSNIAEDNFLINKIQNQVGCSFVKQSGNTDVPKMLALMKAELKKQNSYLEEIFNYDDIILKDDAVVWKGIKAKKIIFCEGYKTTQNPYFNWLPFVLTKGEILTVRIENLETEKVINKGVFILPIGNNLYKVGATYEWKNLVDFPTEEGKEELVAKLKQVLKIPFEIVSHQSGIRPTVKDRRPLIGLHPKHPQLAVFNGMGTKAVMLAPYFAIAFSDFLETGTELNSEVDIKRYYTLENQIQH